MIMEVSVSRAYPGLAAMTGGTPRRPGERLLEQHIRGRMRSAPDGRDLDGHMTSDLCFLDIGSLGRVALILSKPCRPDAHQPSGSDLIRRIGLRSPASTRRPE
jgi:hypothetical protein